MSSELSNRFYYLEGSFADKVAQKAIHDYCATVDALKVRCESPIEEMFLSGLVYVFGFERSNGDLGWDKIDFLKCDYTWPDSRINFDGTFIYLQAQVDKYRVDFLIRMVSEDNVKFLVIECDGHDFHERTKEQAARDRSRDRWMIAQGITVLRFTGSEIWKDPEECAWGVEEAMMAVMGTP